MAVLYFFNLNRSKEGILRLIRSMYSSIYWDKQHLVFYVKRFLDNLKFIQMGLRQLLSGACLPGNKVDKRSSDKKVLAIINSYFREIQFFSRQFFK